MTLSVWNERSHVDRLLPYTVGPYNSSLKLATLSITSHLLHVLFLSVTDRIWNVNSDPQIWNAFSWQCFVTSFAIYELRKSLQQKYFLTNSMESEMNWFGTIFYPLRLVMLYKAGVTWKCIIFEDKTHNISFSTWQWRTNNKSRAYSFWLFHDKRRQNYS